MTGASHDVITGEVLRARVVLESEWLESKCLDRMYLNYVPQLQRVGGVVWYLRGHLGQRFASTATVAPKTAAFVTSIGKFVAGQGVDLVSAGGRIGLKIDVETLRIEHLWHQTQIGQQSRRQRYIFSIPTNKIKKSSIVIM